MDFDGWLSKTYTDSIVIMKDGEVAVEHYAAGQDSLTPHIWMSVSKSILGLIAGILVDQGKLDVSAGITDYIPEVGNCGFASASVRDALDMRVGVKFDENYEATEGPIIEYRKAQSWDPLSPGDTPADLRRFLTTLDQRDGEHGDRFHYVSPNTDLLGWVLERASGTRYADLVSELLWDPLSTERDAYITVDRFGAPRCAGGFCATPADLALVGRLFVTGGKSGRTQVVPASWIDDIIQNGDAKAWRTGDFSGDFGSADMHYRSQWYVVRGERPLIFALGVFGQHVFVDPVSDLVIAKCSSQPVADDADFLMTTLAGVEVLRTMFA